jgi:hypothetical protein
MLATHLFDNRKGITSLKFQAFVQAGMPPYDAGIKDYFETEGSNDHNRIREIDMRSLLLYNGYDALFEFMIGKKQMSLINDQ